MSHFFGAIHNFALLVSESKNSCNIETLKNYSVYLKKSTICIPCYVNIT
jgi:hypothetical protein